MATGGGIAASSIGAFRTRLAQAKTQIRGGAKTGLFQAAVHVRDVANEQVPFEEGDLARDGTPSVSDGDELKAAVSYGLDPEVKAYAERQHEDMTLRHDAGRNAKFLENALNSERDAVLQMVAQGAKSATGGGGR